MADGQLFGLLHSLFQRFQIQPAGSSTDRALLEQFTARQDETAFESLLQRHGHMVLGVCRSILHDLHRAEDAFQATFLVLARKAGSLRRQESVGPWLHRVACRISWRARASGVRRQFHERQVPAMTAPEAADQGDIQESIGVLHEELSRLPDKYRVLVVRCDLQGMSHAHAAAELGVSRVTVTERLGQARERLRRRLLARGLTTAAALVATDLAERACASLPPRLAASTLQAALGFARGQAAAAVAPASVAVLVDGFLHSVLRTRWFLAAAVVLAIGLAGGTGLMLHQLSRVPAGAGQVFGAKQPARSTPVAERKKQRTDLFGDGLPEGALWRLGTIRLSHGSPVGRMEFVPANRLLVSAAQDGLLRLWNLATGAELRRFPFLDSKTPRFCFFALSPDGSVLAANQEDHIAFFETGTGKLLGRCDGPSFHFAFSPDGRTLLAVYQNCVRHWEVPTGRKLREWSHDKDDPNYFYRCAFSPDRRLLAVGDFNQEKPLIHLWDVTAGKQIREWKAHQDYIWSVAFSPDSKALVSTSDDKTVALWFGDTGAEKDRWQVAGRPDEVSIAPDGRTLALHLEDGLHLRDWPTGRERRRMDGVRGPVTFSADGKSMAALSDGLVRVWDTASGQEHRDPLPAHPRKVSNLHYSPDGKLLISWTDGQLLIWQVATGKPLRILPGANVLGFLPEGNVVITSEPTGPGPMNGFTVYQADIATGRPIATFRVAGDPSETLTISPDGRLVALTEAGSKLRFWDLAAGKELRRFEGNRVVHSADFRKVVVVTENWGEVSSASLDNPPAKPTCGGKVDVFEATTGKKLCRIPDYAPALVFKGTNEIDGSTSTSISWVYPTFSPDGATLSVPGENGTRLRSWDAVTGKELNQPPANDASHLRLYRRMQEWGREHKAQLTTCEISPDRPLAIAAYSNRTLAVWEVTTGDLIQTWQGLNGDINYPGPFSPDGRTLSTAVSDGTALVWDLTGLLENGDLPAVTLSPDEADQLWRDLASTKADRAHRAGWRLTAAGRLAVSLLRERLLPAAVTDPGVVARLIAELDSDRFEMREKAKDRLAGMESAKPALRRALAGNPSLEVRQRIEAVLAVLEDPAGTSERIQALRALTVLERIGSPEARQLLQKIAQGAAEARLTREARSSLERKPGRQTSLPPASK